MSLARLQRPINGVLLDISGVLKDGGTVIPGSVDAVNRLQEAGIAIKLVTNETQESRGLIAKKLTAFGYSVTESDIIPPSPNLVKLLQQEELRPHLLVHPDVLSEFEDMEKPRLFSLGQGRYYKDKDGLMLDVGVFTKALEYASGVKAEIIGKPQPEFFKSALREMNVKAEEAIMIGDDIVSDVGGAQQCGLAGVLVRTGKFRPEDETHSEVKPDAIVDNLAQAVKLILDNK